MLYYNGWNLIDIVLYAIIGALIVMSAVITIDSWMNLNDKERIIGYEIDEMRTPTGLPFFDTVGVIVKIRDSIFIKDIGAYKFISKETTYGRTLEGTQHQSPVNSRSAAERSGKNFYRDIPEKTGSAR
jgi:hypothetical protein